MCKFTKKYYIVKKKINKKAKNKKIFLFLD